MAVTPKNEVQKYTIDISNGMSKKQHVQLYALHDLKGNTFVCVYIKYTCRLLYKK